MAPAAPGGPRRGESEERARPRADGEAAGSRLTRADPGAPATPAAAAGRRRVGRLAPGRHAAAVCLPPPPEPPRPGGRPAARTQPRPAPVCPPPRRPAPPPRPSQSRPTLASGPPPAAARCQRAAAPPPRESADAGGRGRGGRGRSSPRAEAARLRSEGTREGRSRERPWASPHQRCPLRIARRSLFGIRTGQTSQPRYTGRRKETMVLSPLTILSKE
ncbi:uncharacterized protein LOC130844732 [Hippopotamus amphibius kiboko]|uniref:uncharacterized protein LOC130844732 n=1 Tax=Hippopotamus amphibius kiboko TaxID=575201 RepID=UPI002594EC9D|nr:uncharacterized protein LOC130844732 [Hippopotamus amphibius kiboko]